MKTEIKRHHIDDEMLEIWNVDRNPHILIAVCHEDSFLGSEIFNELNNKEKAYFEITRISIA